MIASLKEHASLTLSTIKDGSIAAVHDTKVATTIAASTIFAGVTANDIAVLVGITLTTLLIVKTIIDIHLSIRKGKREDLHAILKQETERAKIRSIEKNKTTS